MNLNKIAELDKLYMEDKLTIDELQNELELLGDEHTVLYRTYPTKEEADINAADVTRNGSHCIVKPNPDRSNPYAIWGIWVEPLR